MSTAISLVSYPFLPAKVGGQRGIALFYKYFSRWMPVVCVTVEKNDPTAAEGYEVLNILSNSPLRYINFSTCSACGGSSGSGGLRTDIGASLLRLARRPVEMDPPPPLAHRLSSAGPPNMEWTTSFTPQIHFNRTPSQP